MSQAIVAVVILALFNVGLWTLAFIETRSRGAWSQAISRSNVRLGQFLRRHPVWFWIVLVFLISSAISDVVDLIAARRTLLRISEGLYLSLASLALRLWIRARLATRPGADPSAFPEL